MSVLMSRIKSKLGFERRSSGRLTNAFRPIDDPLRPIEKDLQSILSDVKAIAIDKPTAGRPAPSGDGGRGL